MLKKVTQHDMEKVFNWRNRDDIIAGSTLKKKVSYAEHQAWFERTLQGVNRLFWIVGDDFGTVRVDRNGPQGHISIYLLPEFQGKGIGIRALQEAISAAFDQWKDVRYLTAFIRTENNTSTRAFGKAGFEQIPATTQCPEGHKEFRVWRGRPSYKPVES